MKIKLGRCRGLQRANSEIVCTVAQKRKNKSFADGLLAVDDASYTFYDEVRTCIGVGKEKSGACCPCVTRSPPKVLHMLRLGT